MHTYNEKFLFNTLSLIIFQNCFKNKNVEIKKYKYLICDQCCVILLLYHYDYFIYLL